MLKIVHFYVIFLFFTVQNINFVVFKNHLPISSTVLISFSTTNIFRNKFQTWPTMSKRGRGGSLGGKFHVSLALPVAAVMNCADNTGAKNLYSALYFYFIFWTFRTNSIFSMTTSFLSIIFKTVRYRPFEGVRISLAVNVCSVCFFGAKLPIIPVYFFTMRLFFPSRIVKLYRSSTKSPWMIQWVQKFWSGSEIGHFWGFLSEIFGKKKRFCDQISTPDQNFWTHCRFSMQIKYRAGLH